MPTIFNVIVIAEFVNLSDLLESNCCLGNYVDCVHQEAHLWHPIIITSEPIPMKMEKLSLTVRKLKLKLVW